MKAAFFKEHGGSDKILYDDYRDPVPEAGEALVRVRACGLNHVDLLLLDGRFPPPEGLPHVNGCEVTGTVEALGPGVRGLSPGQRVIVFPGFSCGQCEFCWRGERTVCLRYGYLGAHRDGGYAELVRVPAVNLLPLPDALSFEAGAALPMAMLTAWHALVAKAGVRPGQTVLVHAAGSGVGSAAVQIGKLIGARVLATAGSDAKLAKARELGADEVINHSRQKIADEVKRLTDRRGVDVVFEHVGTATWDASLMSLAPSGRLVTCGATTGYQAHVDIRYLFSRNLSILGSYMGSKAELYDVLHLVAQRKLRAVIDRTMPLEECALAHELMERREQFGKIVLLP